MKDTVMHHKPARVLQAQRDVGIMRTDLLVRGTDVKTRVFYDFPKKYFLIYSQHHNSTQQ